MLLCNLQAALNTMRTAVFNASFGDRNGVQNIAILVSDGNSNVLQSNTIPEASLAKAAGITILSVVTGSSPNISEMTAIASDPIGGVFLMINSNQWSSVVNSVLNTLCN